MRMNDAIAEAVRQEYRAKKKTIYSIAVDHGIPQGSIHYWLRKLLPGEYRQLHSPGYRPRGKIISEETRAAVVRDYLDGVSVEDIATVRGVSVHWVYAHVRKRLSKEERKARWGGSRSKRPEPAKVVIEFRPPEPKVDPFLGPSSIAPIPLSALMAGRAIPRRHAA